jgi:hypothetical protein
LWKKKSLIYIGGEVAVGDEAKEIEEIKEMEETKEIGKKNTYVRWLWVGKRI